MRWIGDAPPRLTTRGMIAQARRDAPLSDRTASPFLSPE
jgi:hypothetical protein